MFSEARVTQMAAHFLMRRGGRMAYLKLMKLLYMAERAALAKWGDSISGDHFVSMPHGPVLSQTYDLINGAQPEPGRSLWQQWIRGETNYEVSLAVDPRREELDELSDSELELLDRIFDEFGRMSRFEIRDFTHNNCVEWEDPHGSSYPISPEAIIRSVEPDPKRADELVVMSRQNRELERAKSEIE